MELVEDGLTYHVAISRTFRRPEDLVPEVFVTWYGWVQWVLQPIDPQNPTHRTYFPAGFEPEAFPIGRSLKTMVITLDKADSRIDDCARILLEFMDMIRYKFADRSAQEITTMVTSLLNQGSFNVTSTLALTTKVWFFWPKNRPVFGLPQDRKRRRALVLFGVKKTRSNRNNFRSLRVDSASIPPPIPEPEPLE